MSKQPYRPAPRTAIKRCVNAQCTSVFQDTQYGKHMRLHNRTKQKEDKSQQGWRCTVCEMTTT
jgi:hypothetical protein